MCFSGQVMPQGLKSEPAELDTKPEIGAYDSAESGNTGAGSDSAAASDSVGETPAPAPFWFVWNQFGHAPSHMHTSIESANEEADRLARNVPGKTFVVLQSISRRKVDQITRVDYAPAPISIGEALGHPEGIKVRVP